MHIRRLQQVRHLWDVRWMVTRPWKYVNLGAVPVAPYAQPSTDEVPDSIASILQEHDAILLAHHGALTVGESLTRAYFRMESLEMFAKTSLYIHLLGGAPDMPEDKINALMDPAPERI